MKKTMKIVAACLAVAAIVVTGCKKGDTGPAGANGTNGVVPTSTDGFIKGTVNGTRQNGDLFTLTFNFQNYWGGHSATLDSAGFGYYIFSLQRANDVLGNDGCSMSISSISTTTVSSVSTGTVSLGTLRLSQSLGANKEFDFSANNSPTVAASQLSYNPATGLFTGNFGGTIAANQNSTGNTANINGSFSCTVTQLYMMVQHTKPNKVVKD